MITDSKPFRVIIRYHNWIPFRELQLSFIDIPSYIYLITRPSPLFYILLGKNWSPISQCTHFKLSHFLPKLKIKGSCWPNHKPMICFESERSAPCIRADHPPSVRSAFFLGKILVENNDYHTSAIQSCGPCKHACMISEVPNT